MRRHLFGWLVSRRSSCVLLVAGLLVGVPMLGHAQGDSSSVESLSESEKQKYQTLLREGKSAYSEKNFEEAFQKLKKAHAIHSKNSILFNMGLISEKQGKLERASEYYQKFIEAPDVSLEARQRASERMAAVNEILNKSGGGKTEAQKTNLMPALEAMNTEVDEETSESEEGEETERASATDSGEEASADTGETSGMAAGQDESTGGTDGGSARSSGKLKYSWPVYASFGVGTVALATGVYTLTETFDRIDKAKKFGRTPSTRIQHLKYEQQASTYATTTTGLFIGGAALAGLGTYFLVRKGSMTKRDRKSGKASNNTPEVSISVGDEYTGAQLSVDF